MGFFKVFFKRLLRKVHLTSDVEGSAACRVAIHDTQVQAARGAIIALRASEKAHHDSLNELVFEADRIHAGRDGIDARIAGLQKKLGF